MEETRLSFIPKKGLAGSVSKDGGYGFLLSLSLVALFCSGLLSGGVFLYKSSIAADIASKNEELNKRKEELDVNTIKEIRRVSQKIEALKAIIAGHRSFIYFFDTLGKNTIKSVRFSNFSYTENQDGPMITMQGFAKSYGSVALQSEKFKDLPYVKENGIIFSGLGLKDAGAVGFSVKISADPMLFSYNPNKNTQ